MNQLKKIFAASAAAVALAAPMAAQAGVGLCLDDGAGGLAELCLTDGAAGDFNNLSGAITYVGSYGGWVLHISSAVGEPVYANGYGMQLQSTNTGVGDLVIKMTQTDMSFGSGGPISANGFFSGNILGGPVSYSLYADDANAAFGTGSLLFSGSTGAGNSFADRGGNNFASTDGTFSLTSVVTIKHANMATTGFTFDAQVPEPATLALLGLGLLGIGASSRRKAAQR